MKKHSLREIAVLLLLALLVFLVANLVLSS
jgi:hypothetical protein